MVALTIANHAVRTFQQPERPSSQEMEGQDANASVFVDKCRVLSKAEDSGASRGEG